jgi:hypothetical protein
MDEISKHRIHIVPRLHDQFRSIFFRGAYTVFAQLSASSRLQNLPVVLSHRARLRRFEKKQSEPHNFRV